MTSPPALPVITVFERSPDEGRGLARDMRVRWALEEVGQPYVVRPVSFATMKEPAYRALQPFGQIPAFTDGDLTLFESGAIVLHIARRREGLLAGDDCARERAIAWLFAALNTVEPPIIEREIVEHGERKEPWSARHLAALDGRIRLRLRDLSARLGTADWLDSTFSAGDLMMADVLRRLGNSGLLEAYPRLVDYVARAEARPAFQRAFDAQRAFFNTTLTR